MSKIDINDIIFFIGLGTTGYGLWLYSPAVSLTVTGGILMVSAYMRVDAGGDS